MVIALFLAYIFPFELFLFSYIVLGPLHYMTELTWLKEKSFFTSESFNWRFLMLVAFFLIGLILIPRVHKFHNIIKGAGLYIILLIGWRNISHMRILPTMSSHASISKLPCREKLIKFPKKPALAVQSLCMNRFPPGLAGPSIMILRILEELWSRISGWWNFTVSYVPSLWRSTLDT